MNENLKRIFRIIRERHFYIPIILLNRIICNIRSYYYSRKIDGGGGKIIITKPFIRFKIKKDKSANLYIKGKFRVVPHIEGDNTTAISMGVGSNFRVNGDFTVGQGVRFFLSKRASLTIGGKDKESDSGITADTLIMVSKKIEIGVDFICAWNVFISDSDWHSIEGQINQKDIFIGNHVWVANTCSILKGTIVGENTIVASHSKIINKEYPKNVLLAGTPGKIVKRNINWSR